MEQIYLTKHHNRVEAKWPNWNREGEGGEKEEGGRGILQLSSRFAPYFSSAPIPADQSTWRYRRGWMGRNESGRAKPVIDCHVWSNRVAPAKLIKTLKLKSKPLIQYWLILKGTNRTSQQRLAIDSDQVLISPHPHMRNSVGRNQFSRLHLRWQPTCGCDNVPTTVPTTTATWNKTIHDDRWQVYLRSGASVSEHGRISTLCQIEEEEVGLVHQILGQAAHATLRIRRMQKSLRVPQQKSYSNQTKFHWINHILYILSVLLLSSSSLLSLLWL